MLYIFFFLIGLWIYGCAWIMLWKMYKDKLCCVCLRRFFSSNYWGWYNIIETLNELWYEKKYLLNNWLLFFTAFSDSVVKGSVYQVWLRESEQWICSCSTKHNMSSIWSQQLHSSEYNPLKAEVLFLTAKYWHSKKNIWKIS